LPAILRWVAEVPPSRELAASSARALLPFHPSHEQLPTICTQHAVHLNNGGINWRKKEQRLRTWPFSKTGAEQEKKGATWSIFSTTAMGYCIFQLIEIYSSCPPSKI
jgi:hypothetical protein